MCKADVTCISVLFVHYLYSYKSKCLCSLYELLMRRARDCFSTINNEATDAGAVQWVEIIEPKTQQRMFANMMTGECLWDAPLEMD